MKIAQLLGFHKVGIICWPVNTRSHLTQTRFHKQRQCNITSYTFLFWFKILSRSIYMTEALPLSISNMLSKYSEIENFTFIDDKRISMRWKLISPVAKLHSKPTLLPTLSLHVLTRSRSQSTVNYIWILNFSISFTKLTNKHLLRILLSSISIIPWIYAFLTHIR